jgi:hypothetical protein
LLARDAIPVLVHHPIDDAHRVGTRDFRARNFAQLAGAGVAVVVPGIPVLVRLSLPRAGIFAAKGEAKDVSRIAAAALTIPTTRDILTVFVHLVVDHADVIRTIRVVALDLSILAAAIHAAVSEALAVFVLFILVATAAVVTHAVVALDRRVLTNALHAAVLEAISVFVARAFVFAAVLGARAVVTCDVRILASALSAPSFETLTVGELDPVQLTTAFGALAIRANQSAR